PPPAQPGLSAEALDRYSTAITQAITNALEASTKRSHKHPSGHRWWNEDCQNAISALQRASRDPDSPPVERETAKRIFHCTIRQAKRQYWHTQIDNFTDSRDIFRAVKWN